MNLSVGVRILPGIAEVGDCWSSVKWNRQALGESGQPALARRTLKILKTMMPPVLVHKGSP